MGQGLATTVSFYLSVYAGFSHPLCVLWSYATLIFNSNSTVPKHISLEDLFPVRALAVSSDHFPPEIGFYGNSV